MASSPLPLTQVSCCREAWIREQMAKRLGQALGEAEQMHPDDELYAVPKDLQVSVHPIRQHADVLAAHCAMCTHAETDTRTPEAP